MDWKAAEHTFFLICDNLGKGCTQWFNWNFLLPKKGTSPWGWNQNALIELDPDTRTVRYTPEYYAVKHFSQALSAGDTITVYIPLDERGISGLVTKDKSGRESVFLSNTKDQARDISLKFGAKYLNVTLPPHSLSSFRNVKKQ